LVLHVSVRAGHHCFQSVGHLEQLGVACLAQRLM
jgi:hypothetical protein